MIPAANRPLGLVFTGAGIKTQDGALTLVSDPDTDNYGRSSDTILIIPANLCRSIKQFI